MLKVQVATIEVLKIIDGQDRALGEMTVETRDGNLLCGKFAPGPAFSAVSGLFRNYEEAVNSQALGVVATLDKQIADLGLRLRSQSGAGLLELHDVQIWSDGGISCRLTRHDPGSG